MISVRPLGGAFVSSVYSPSTVTRVKNAPASRITDSAVIMSLGHSREPPLQLYGPPSRVEESQTVQLVRSRSGDEISREAINLSEDDAMVTGDLREPREEADVEGQKSIASSETNLAEGASDKAGPKRLDGERLSDAELEQIRQLGVRDREVRMHEQAHKAVGGQYAGAISYTYERGPDGRRYAVGGEVPIDLSEADDPEATIAKMQIVRRAALAPAPAEPSAQDRRVAAEASSIEQRARAELMEARAQERLETDETNSLELKEEGVRTKDVDIRIENTQVRDINTTPKQVSREHLERIYGWFDT